MVARVQLRLFQLSPDNFVAKLQERSHTDQVQVTQAIAKCSPAASDRLSMLLSTKPVRGKKPEDEGTTFAATIIQSVERGRRGRKLSKEIRSGIVPFEQRMSAEDDQLREKLDAYRQRKERRRGNAAESGKEAGEPSRKPPIPRQGIGRPLTSRRSAHQHHATEDARKASSHPPTTGSARSKLAEQVAPAAAHTAVRTVISTPVRRLREEAEKLRTLITLPDAAPSGVCDITTKPAPSSGPAQALELEPLLAGLSLEVDAGMLSQR